MNKEERKISNLNIVLTFIACVAFSFASYRLFQIRAAQGTTSTKWSLSPEILQWVPYVFIGLAIITGLVGVIGLIVNANRK